MRKRSQMQTMRVTPRPAHKNALTKPNKLQNSPLLKSMKPPRKQTVKLLKNRSDITSGRHKISCRPFLFYGIVLQFITMKSGFVALVGRSNVGKSTLLNTLVGTKIAATSFRPQMTRHIIHGVLNTPSGQAVFVDTPGILKEKKSVLTGKLLEKVKEAIEDIDLIIYVVDPSREIG